MSDEPWLDIAGEILDGKAVSWDAVPSGRTSDDPVSADEMRLISDVAEAHRSVEPAVAGRWGSFELLEKVGHGTFGDVFRARDSELDRDVALKLLAHAPAPVTLEEGRLLARVRHPNVVTVHGAGVHDGRYGIWMEFVRGCTLGDIVDELGPLPWRDVATIGADVCAALTAVHSSGLLHGDVKARNVMREDGGRIVLMDFGTGRLAVDPTVRVSGTPLYIAPEVLDGASPDVRSDIYSTGVLLYYLLAGEHPVEGASLPALRAAHDGGEQRPVRERQRRCPRGLAAIIDHAISRDPARRFQSAEALQNALRRVLQRRATSSRAAMFTIGALISGLAGIGAYAWIPARPLTLTSGGNASSRTVAREQSTPDFAGTWVDNWTEDVCGYACGTPPGGGGTTFLVLASDSATTFHGKYDLFPITGTVRDNSILFTWQDYPTGAGIAQGSCKGMIVKTDMSLKCTEWIQSPSSGLLLNGTNTDRLTKETATPLRITLVAGQSGHFRRDDRRPSANRDVLQHEFRSFSVRLQYMNVGSTRSNVASAELFLSRSGATRDILLGSITVGALDPYQIGDLSSVIKADPPPSGTYFLLACFGMECRRSAGQLVVIDSNAAAGAAEMGK